MKIIEPSPFVWLRRFGWIVFPLALVFAGGCATGKGLVQPQYSVVTNQTPQIVTVTNTVTQTNIVIATVTNSVGVPATVTNIIVQQVPIIIRETNTVETVRTQLVGYAVNPAVTNAVNTVSPFLSLIPPPFNSIVSDALGIAVAGLGFYARQKFKAAVSNGTALDTAQTILGAVLTGVEAAGDAKTKTSIQTAAVAAGVQSDLHAAVQSITGSMPKAVVGTQVPLASAPANATIV